jgi:hypothetical protein
MYKSSSMTFAFKYIFIPIWTLSFLFVIISMWNDDNQLSRDWARGSALMFGWALIWLTVIFIRLKTVSATNDSIVIKTIHGQKSVSYKDIEWISQIAMVVPPLISLKYFDNESGQSRKILIMLNRNFEFFNFNLLKEQEMTLYIRERIIATKPDYIKENEPSKWLPGVFVILSGIPFIILNNLYFMNF